MVRWTLGLVALLLVLGAREAEACMRGGISNEATVAILGLCVVFSPILIPGALVVGATAAVQSQSVRKAKRRGSNFIRTQRNKAIRKIGLRKFSSYMEELEAYATENQWDYDKQLEFGTALFINEDYSRAYDVLTLVLDHAGKSPIWWNKLPMAYYLRGLTNQFLGDYEEACEDFMNVYYQFQFKVQPDGEDGRAMEAGPDGNKPAQCLPRITVEDARNSKGFSHLLRALYGVPDESLSPMERKQLKREQLMLAREETKIAMTGAPSKGSFTYNHGLATYFLAIENYEDGEGEDPRKLLRKAVQYFDRAIQSGNFGNGSEGYAMKAQAMALQEHWWPGLAKEEIMKECRELQSAADARDRKVFLVDLEDVEQLITPWPLPIDNHPLRKGQHDFKTVFFTRPTWCQHCNGFSKSAVGCVCTVCGYKIHRRCRNRAKARNCWSREEAKDAKEAKEEKPTLVTLEERDLDSDEEAEEMNRSTCNDEEDDESEVALVTAAAAAEATPSQHVHNWQEVFLYKPTWCATCKGFIRQGFHKHASTCKECRTTIHTSCKSSTH